MTISVFHSSALVKLTIVMLLACCIFVLGFGLGQNNRDADQQHLFEQASRVEPLYQEVEALTKKNHQLSAELELEQLSNKKTIQNLTTLSSELFDLKKEVSVYQSVMAPELIDNGLAILNWQLDQYADERYAFRFILYQSNQRKNTSKGQISIWINGQLNGESQSLDLAKRSGMSQDDKKFIFRYFQGFEGSFDLPAEFKVNQIVVTAEISRSKWQKYQKLEQTFPWPFSLSENVELQQKQGKETANEEGKVKYTEKNTDNTDTPYNIRVKQN